MASQMRHIVNIRCVLEDEQRKKPNRERALAITKLQEAEMWLDRAEIIHGETDVAVTPSSPE